MNSGTAPNTSIVLTDTELDYINRRFAGRKSAAIHQALDDMMTALPFPFAVDYDDLTPVLSPYNSQWSETCELDIDGEKRTATIDVPVPGQSGMSMRDYHGYYMTITFGYVDEQGCNIPNPKALNDYLNSAEAQALLGSVCDGFDTTWDGSNNKGHFDDDAQTAAEELSEGINALPHESVAAWQADDWFGSTTPGEYGITAATTDAEIATIASRLETEAWNDGGYSDHALVDGIDDLLTRWRNDLRDDETD